MNKTQFLPLLVAVGTLISTNCYAIDSLQFPPSSEEEALGIVQKQSAAPNAMPQQAAPAAMRPGPAAKPTNAPTVAPQQFPPNAAQMMQNGGNQARNYRYPNMPMPQYGYNPYMMGYPAPMYGGYAPRPYGMNPYSGYMSNPYAGMPQMRMPLPTPQKSNEKKPWGDTRYIWPDFYTDFTGDMWDKMMNTPYDMGYMPGGWRFPSLSSPDPVTVGDAVTNQFPPIMEEAGNFVNFAN